MSEVTDDTEIFKKVLELERDAMARYAKHIAIINDPRINSVLEGLKRNETEHTAEIEGLMARLRNTLKGRC